MTHITRRTALITGACAALMPARALAATAFVSAVQVRKGARRLELISDGRVVRAYPVSLGKDPSGPKRFEGDGRTPEGAYVIDRRLSRSSYFLSLGISYPTMREVAAARRAGRSAGSNIFVHGQPNSVIRPLEGDWTQGCVALSNEDMREAFFAVPVGCPIRIYA